MSDATKVIDLNGQSHNVTVETTTSVLIQGLGHVKVVSDSGATVERLLSACLLAHNADPAAVNNLFPVVNGEDADASTVVQPGGRVTAANRGENG